MLIDDIDSGELTGLEYQRSAAKYKLELHPMNRYLPKYGSRPAGLPFGKSKALRCFLTEFR
jgi:hypothetical protein